MLVLSRKAGERIHIGDEIFIEVRRVAGNRVTLAVNAPREVRVLRGELLEAAKSFEETPAEPAAKAAVPPETIIVTHEHYVRNDPFPVSHSM
jgi:carbon storage regulator